MTRHLFALLTSTALYLGCSSAPSASAPAATSTPIQLGNPCVSDDDCPGLVCAEGTTSLRYCTQPCVTDADCTDADGGVCVADLQGRQVCVAACAGNGGDFASQSGFGWTCVNGRPVACPNAGPPSCGCGCGAGTYCVDAVGCQPLAATGEPCAGGSVCASGVCNFYEDPAADGTGTCAAPLGGPCLPDACTVCVQPADASAPALCSTACSANDPCPTGWQCRGQPGSYECLPDCDSKGDCPQGFTCNLFDADGTYCDASAG